MLLVVELARLEVELDSKDIPHPIRHDQVPAKTDGIRDKLNDVCGDGDAGIAQGEEHVDAGADAAEKQADYPGTNSVGGQINIVVADNSADLRLGRYMRSCDS
jgi:hypothetical protein